ncbi:MAG: FAD-dependent oxidoreductase [Deltaproteobacteria bacterium]|nr:FAD-dependent oxidoreductase [Deltaproteobacteria bacterium]
MSRSSLFDRLRRIITLSEHADRRGLSSDDAVAELRAAEERRLDRRGLIKAAGAVAAGAVAAKVMTSRSARAAPRGAGPDVAIVGAGMAGLACADALAAKGIYATLYEASNRAGGRVYSRGLSFPGPGEFPGQVIELGGELVDTAHGTMRGYANRFGFAMENIFDNPGEETFVVDGVEYSHARVIDEWRALVPALKDDLRRSSGAPTAAAHSDFDKILDAKNLADYLVEKGAGPVIRGIISAAYTGEYGGELSAQSAFNLLLFMHMDNRGKFKPFGVFSDEKYHLAGGNEQIPRALAAELDSQIDYGAWLVKLERLASGNYRLHFKNSDGLKTWGSTWSVDHDRVVLAIPFSVLRNVELAPSLGLPDWKRNVINNFGYGTNAKLMISFTRPTWHDHDRNGGGFIWGVPNMLNTWETNNVNATESRAVLTDYTGGTLGAQLDPKNASGEATKFLTSLERFWPGVLRDVRKSGGKPVATLQHWPSVPTVMGSYTCNAPGYFTTMADLEAVPVDKLYFAGEHADSFYSWQGFMEGACLSGLNAANTIVKSR